MPVDAGGGGIRSIKLVVLALGLLALSVMATAQFATPASSLFGWSYSATAEELARVQARAPTDARIATLAVRALRDQPIAAEPLIAAALAAGDLKSSSAAEQMREAKRRQPRIVAVRAWLATHYLSQQDYRRAFVELNRLVALRPDMAKALNPVLLSAARTPGGWREVNRAAAAGPAWKASFVTDLMQRQTDESENAAFALIAGDGAGRAKQDNLQQLLLQRLVARGEYERAYLAWLNFLPVEAMAGVGLVYDPEFRRMPGLPPFNWSILPTDAGLAEYAVGGGIDLRFYGTATAPLLRQTILLPPANYALTVAARNATGSESGATIVVGVQCAGTKTALAEIPLSGLGAELRSYGAVVTVPEQGCPAQSLTIVGSPGDAAGEVNAHVRSISLKRVER